MEPHIVKSFDAELEKLLEIIARMGGMAETNLGLSLQALSSRDSDTATKVVQSDQRVDELEAQANEQVVRLLALRSPVADDLRAVVGALKISGALERIADYAANVAKRSLVLNQMPPVAPVRAVARMGALVQALLKEVLDAYLQRDAGKAEEAWRRDAEVDELYHSLFREILTYMMEDPRNITACSHLMFIAKNIERIGDHATNVAEMTYYLVTGHPLSGARPKGGDHTGA